MFAHIDADSFFASVLQRQHPELKNKPLLAIGMGGSIVIAASYEAKAFGVKTGMSLGDARKLVPSAIERSADFRETGLASEQIETILKNICPLIEQMSIDDWYLDLRSIAGGMPRDLPRWATTLREQILRKTALSMSIGIAPSKLLAKMAGEYRKPGGVTIVTCCSLACCSIKKCIKKPVTSQPATSCKRTMNNIHLCAFLSDRPAAAIPGIGRRTEPKVKARGWMTAWDIAIAPTEALVKILGRPGRDMQSELLGKPVASVTTESAPPKSVSRARSFRKSSDRNFLWAHLLRHLEYLVLKMRREEMMCRGLSVWLRDGDYHHHGVNRSLPQAFATEDQLLPFVRECFEKLLHVPHPNPLPLPREREKKFLFSPLPEGEGEASRASEGEGASCTQVGLALWRLTSTGPSQSSLFDDPEAGYKGDDLQKTLDQLHEQFGRNAVTRASALKVKSGTSMGLNHSTY